MSFIGCDVATNKYHHHCGINVAVTVCSALICCYHCVYMLHVSVIVCDIVASKCRHNCGINVAVTVCSDAAAICFYHCV